MRENPEQPEWSGIPQMTIRLAQFGLFGSSELWAKIPIPWSAPLRRPTVSARGGDDFILRIFRSGIAPTPVTSVRRASPASARHPATDASRGVAALDGLAASPRSRRRPPAYGMGNGYQ